MSNSAVELLRTQFKSAHETLENMMSDVTVDQAHWSPPGVANPLGATYAHIVASEDGVFNGMFKGAAPLMASSYAGNTGLSELPPQGFEWAEWGRSVQVDLAALKAYAQAVYAATDEYLGTLNDADLGGEVDLSAAGAGTMTVGQFSSIMLANVQWHTGEIACLKGLQGAKGYQI